MSQPLIDAMTVVGILLGAVIPVAAVIGNVLGFFMELYCSNGPTTPMSFREEWECWSWRVPLWYWGGRGASLDFKKSCRPSWTPRQLPLKTFCGLILNFNTDIWFDL